MFTKPFIAAALRFSYVSVTSLKTAVIEVANKPTNKSVLIFMDKYLRRFMGKPTISIGENKDADQLRGYIAVTAKLISAFVFATRTVQFLFYLNPKFQASSSFLCLYRPVCVGPVRKPHCWFSHKAAHFIVLRNTIMYLFNTSAIF